ncbi:MAG: DUF2950 domain-containing protein [Pseudomonadota bacterium]
MSRPPSLARASTLAAVMLVAMASAAVAQQPFKTPDDAAVALATAVRSGDRTSMLAVLGRDAADIISSGDTVADAATRQRFLAAYDARHEVNPDGDKATMMVGQEDFPVPIPLVRKDGQWRFDTAAGRDEILFRRIGRNELDAIQACLAYVDAQSDYADKDRTGAGPGVYAQHIISNSGKTDGLYWKTAPGDEASPLGELVAQATSEGYSAGGQRAPFRGYYFKILTRQGPAAPGGALNYLVHGKMIGGFALVAWPADYGNSGVMTFLVSHGGTIYQKNLGDHTEQLAERMTAFNPDDTWKKVEATDQQQ